MISTPVIGTGGNRLRAHLSYSVIDVAVDLVTFCNQFGCGKGFPFTINWGDGSSSVSNTYVMWQASHIYAKTGNYTITMSASDKDGATGSASVKAALK